MAKTMAALSFRVPDISQAEMQTFFASHFSSSAIDHFHTRFLRPDPSVAGADSNAGTDEEEYIEYDDEYDDGLGYYEDGVKRTLTDEQIAIFRHSELEALRRQNESSKVAKPVSAEGRADAHEQRGLGSQEEQLSDGEISAAALPSAPKKKKKKNNKRRNNKRNEGEPIDLRKRTWDVVEQGLATLDYEDDASEKTTQISAAKRQRISYDD